MGERRCFRRREKAAGELGECRSVGRGRLTPKPTPLLGRFELGSRRRNLPTDQCEIAAHRSTASWGWARSTAFELDAGGALTYR